MSYMFYATIRTESKYYREQQEFDLFDNPIPFPVDKERVPPFQ